MTNYWNKIDIPRAEVIGGGKFTLSRLKDITVLFGKNGAGKSLLLRSWRDSHPNFAHYIVPERTGEIGFAPHLSAQELNESTRHDAHRRNFLPDYRQRVLARIQGYLMRRGNHRGSGEVPGGPEKIEAMIGELLPEFKVTLVNNAADPLQLERLDKGRVTSIDELSSGEAQLLWMSVDMLVEASNWLIEATPKRVLLLDEPDAHIHPDLLARFAYFLTKAVSYYKFQLVVATHSTALLASLGQFGGETTGVIYLTRDRTDYRALPYTSHLKELASCLGGHVLMGALFGAPLLIVEGDDDYRLWSEVPRRHKVRLAVIPAHGSDEVTKFQRALEKVMSSLREVDDNYSGYALLDGDKQLPNPSRDYPQDHVPYLGLACHEAENLYLSNEVLASLGLEWDTAKALLVKHAADYGSKGDYLAGAPGWDRRWVDIKNCISEISKVLDTKQVHWTARVGATLGRDKPSGQLAEFLGDSVVDALWKESDDGRVAEHDEDAKAETDQNCGDVKVTA